MSDTTAFAAAPKPWPNRRRPGMLPGHDVLFRSSGTDATLWAEMGDLNGAHRLDVVTGQGAEVGRWQLAGGRGMIASVVARAKLCWSLPLALACGRLLDSAEERRAAASRSTRAQPSVVAARAAGDAEEALGAVVEHGEPKATVGTEPKVEAGEADRLPAVAGVGAAVTPARPTYRRCRAGVLPPRTGLDFVHRRSAVVAALGPNHSVQDAIARPGKPVQVAAKIAYGDMGKDLERERVEVLLDDCTAFVVRGVGHTDDDGIVRLDFDAPLQPGAYGLVFRVIGDGSLGKATLHVLPEGTQMVVFDLDGTLTTDDAEVREDVLHEHFHDLARGDYVAEAYAHGDALTHLWARQGFIVVYLTGRPYWLIEHTRAWLAQGHFAPGIVHTTLRHRDVMPTVAGVGAFKAAFLRGLLDRGYRIAAAYGNAPTDVWAYGQAGVPPKHTFIIGPHGGQGGTVAVTGDWSAALPWARGHGAAAQAFVWAP